MTDPSGARLPKGKHTVGVKPRERARSGVIITSPGSIPSCRCSVWRNARRRSLCSHQSRHAPSVSPLTVFTVVSSRPARRRCSITSATPPARNTCTVAKFRGPFGSASTSRGTRRLTSAQSSTVGRRKPAENATAGRCITRFVDPPKAACTTMAFFSAAAVSTSATPIRNSCMRFSALAERRAASSQMGWPEGDSAVCGNASPSASATTCEVAAVPRNWHPPPGVAQVRQPTSAAYSSVICCCAKRAPIVWALAASSPASGSSVTPPGTSTAGIFPADASAIIMAGSPLSQVATPNTPLPVGRERIRRRSTIAASLRNGSESIIPVVPCVRPSQGSVQAPAKGTAPRAFNSRAASATSRPTSQCPV